MEAVKSWAKCFTISGVKLLIPPERWKLISLLDGKYSGLGRPLREGVNPFLLLALISSTTYGVNMWSIAQNILEQSGFVQQDHGKRCSRYVISTV